MSFFRQSLLTLFSNSGMTLLGLLTGLLLARTLGPTGRGLMTTVMIWPAVLVWAAGLSLGYANIYFAASEPSKRQALFANSFWMAIFLGEAAGVVAAWGLPKFLHLNSSQHFLLTFSLLLLSVGLFSDYASSLLQGTGRFDQLALVRMIAPLVIGVLLMGLWAGHLVTVTSVVVVTWVGSLCQFSCTLYFLGQAGCLSLRPDHCLLRRSINYSLRIHPGTLAGLANGRIDQLLMTALVAPRLLGFYALAVTFSELSRQLSASIATVLFSRMAGEVSADARRAMATRATRWTLLIGCAGGLCLGLAAHPFVALLWGSRFLEAVPTIYVLLPGTVALGVASSMASSLNGAGRPGVTTLAEIASLLVMIPLLWVLLPRFGILGAGVASTIGYIVNCLVTGKYFAQTFGPDALRELRPSQHDWNEMCIIVGRMRMRVQPARGCP